MLSAFQNAFKIPDLRKRIIFTLLLLVVLRLGAHITMPGIDDAELENAFKHLTGQTEEGEEQGGGAGGILQLYDLFAGRAFSQMTIFALGIQPYISASIILQLLTVVVPYLERLSKEGPTGQKKITQYTRYGTVILAAVQAIGISVALRSKGFLGGYQVVHEGMHPVTFTFIAVVTLMAGTTFVMWLGEQISERGIGNGISLIIFANIVARIPNGAYSMMRELLANRIALIQVLLFFAVVVVIIMGVIFITLGTRKIPVQYAKRVVGRKVYGGQMTHLPLRVNQAGVIPIIFAITLISFPTTLGRMVPDTIPGGGFVQTMVRYLSEWPMYHILYAVLIIFFTYFYTAVTTNPVDLADNMKKYGGFIPGIRPGKPTAEYIDRSLTRITLVGAFFLAGIALLPYILSSHLGVPIRFGGTPLLIVVGVGLDTMQQIESHLIMRHYEGFLKKGRLRGRSRR